MKLVFCGGAGEVGASCIFLEIDGKKFLLDCGMRMTKVKDNLPDFRTIQENGGVDAIFVSHAHMDHIGALPVISREYPDAPIYCTHATKDLIRLLLFDSLKIMEKQEAEIPVFSEVQVKSMLERIICYNPNNVIRVVDNINATFFNAGHILGASSIYFTSDEGSFFYSGDFSVTPQSTVEGASIPKLRPDVAIFESTYGDRLHSNRQGEEKRLVDTVREVIERKGKILIPAFALGRAQEVILILKKAINKNELPDIPVYIDGMVKDVCTIYENNPNYLRSVHTKRILKGNWIFTDDNVVKVTNPMMRKQIIESSEPCCIISSSGMLTGGPSQEYAKALFQQENHFIAITGYQDEESPGRSLLALTEPSLKAEEKFLILDGVSYKVHCGIGKYGLSAHGDKSQISALVANMTPRRIFFNHGEAEVISGLAKEIAKDIYAQIFVPSNNEVFELDIHNPRKQIQREKLIPMGRQDELSNEKLSDLREYILNRLDVKRGYTVEELYYIWYGKEPVEDDLITLNRILNESKYFEHDYKRTYIFHPAADSDITMKDNGIMEVNEMLRYAEEHFPKEVGLYKTGARQDDKIAILNFDFPLMVKKNYPHLIDEFRQKTGWSVEVKDQCNMNAAHQLIYVLFEQNGLVPGKVSYYQDTNTFAVKINEPVQHETIKEKFHETTGLTLQIESLGAGQKEKPFALFNPGLAGQGNRIEQNEAFMLIDLFFSEKNHQPYRKSIKKSHGVSYIELSFLTRHVGQLYTEELKELSKSIGWPMTVNPAVNNYELTALARRLLTRYNVQTFGKISYIPTDETIKVQNVDATEDIKKAIRADFFKEAAIPIVL